MDRITITVGAFAEVYRQSILEADVDNIVGEVAQFYGVPSDEVIVHEDDTIEFPNPDGQDAPVRIPKLGQSRPDQPEPMTAEQAAKSYPDDTSTRTLIKRLEDGTCTLESPHAQILHDEVGDAKKLVCDCYDGQIDGETAGATIEWLVNALAVILLTNQTSRFIAENDPQAYRQAVKALELAAEHHRNT